MAAIRRTPRADEDLYDIFAYIAQFDEAAAERMIRRLHSLFDLLASMPRMGRARPDLGPEIRHAVSRPYLVLYRALEDGVEIVRVIHGRRDLAALDL